MHCPTCHATLPDDAEMCDACNQELCPQCHAAIPPRATMCLNCGASWTLTCPDCGQTVLPIDLRCPACGLSFEGDEVTEECPHCGREMPEDVDVCPHCGGELKIIAAILKTPVVERILTHLGLQARAPPRAADA